MKIRIERKKLVKAVEEAEGVQIVVENVEDAREALDAILRKSELFATDDFVQPSEILVTSSQEYTTSAVDYDLVFTLEFVFGEDVTPESRIGTIRQLQRFFQKF
jgi:hypothetical protein